MAFYEIVVQNLIDKKRFREFPDMEITYLEGDRTLIAGKLIDQAQLFSIINKIRDMNLELILIKKDHKDIGGLHEKFN